MDDGLKQRLIGALVLFALAVIFIPVVFDRERIEPVNRTTLVPASPQIKTLEIPPTVVPDPQIDPAPPPEEMYIPERAEEIDQEPEPAGVDKVGAPLSWVMQIASFRFEKHAEELRDKLIADGYASYVAAINTANGKMTRVFVGPKFDKTLLIEAKDKIRTKYNVEPFIVRFKP